MMRLTFAELSQAQQPAPLDLIHRNNCSKPVTMRVSERFEGGNPLPLSSLKAPCPLSFLMGWRASNGAKSRT